MNKLCICLFAVFFLLLFSCQRNSTLSDSVTFKGAVNYGVLNSSGNIVYLGAASSAKVVCSGFSEYATSGSDGSYTLTVNANRQFTANNADNYTLRAFDKYGADETVSASGKPGDVVSVRSFILYKHTAEGQ